jgi:hypothetical protein
MHVDRTKFLVLTSALLASCKSAETPQNAPIMIPQQPPPVASIAREPEPPPTTPDAGASVEPIAVDDDEDPYEPWPGTATVPLAKTVHGQTCDAAENAKGTVACALRPPGPTCESFGETKSECARLRGWLVPRVAEKAAKCLNAKSGKQDICYFNIGAACIIQAFDGVCLDLTPKIESSCKRVMSKCASVEKQYRHINLAACRAAMSSVVPQRHGKLIACMQESCDLVPCTYAAGS